MSHSAQNGSFQRLLLQPISWRVLKKLNRTQQKQTPIQNTKILQGKVDPMNRDNEFTTIISSLKTFHAFTAVLLIQNLATISITIYRTQWTAEGSVFGFGHHQSVGFFVCVWNISGTAERICTKFTQMCLVPRSDKSEGQGHQGQKNGIFRPFRRPACGLCLEKHL